VYIDKGCQIPPANYPLLGEVTEILTSPLVQEDAPFLNTEIILERIKVW
jgi:hypothetical protein